MTDGQQLRIERGPVVVVQCDTDPGDMGEPRVVRDDGETIVFVPSFELWPSDAAIEASVGANPRVLAMLDQPLVRVEEDGYHDHTGIPCRTCVVLGSGVRTLE